MTQLTFLLISPHSSGVIMPYPKAKRPNLVLWKTTIAGQQGPLNMNIVNHLFQPLLGIVSCSGDLVHVGKDVIVRSEGVSEVYFS
jgi:hypothetical protein